MLHRPSLCCVLSLCGPVALRAEVKPNPLFADNAVLQQGMEVPVWGTAHDGESVMVEFAGQRVSTDARDGKWSVRLRPLTAPRSAPNFCEVGVFFARALQASRHVPVGLVWTTWGGTQAEAWTSREALAALPAYRPSVENNEKAAMEYPVKLAQGFHGRWPGQEIRTRRRCDLRRCIDGLQPAVPTPTAVRYSFVNVPDVNLFNVEGLPASPFRTDVE